MTLRLNTDQLLTRWLSAYSEKLPTGTGILRIHRAEPRFQTRNFFDRFKIFTAHFDGTGQNPTNVRCSVVEVSVTDQAVNEVLATSCDDVKDQG